MTSKHHHRKETHFISRVGWLRAAILGANDGIISVSSLVVGVAASPASKGQILLTGVAALVAGALSMAAGEYVSVSSQFDTEHADLEREKQELHEDPESELDELTQIWVARGLDDKLARQVAEQLTREDALAAHARDELGLSAELSAKPLQAAFTSAVTFTSGALLPLVAMVIAPRDQLAWWVSGAAIVLLAVLGALGAITGGAGVIKGTVRVAFWGALAMAVTAGIGKLFGAVT